MAPVVIVGAGAAGLATAVFAGARTILLDGAARPGAKILVSGGSRCNVTNRVVTERDFWGGKPTIVRRVLRAFPADRATAWFRDLGVALHEEDDGRLFPDSNRSRDVLDALMRAAAESGADIRVRHRVTAIERVAEGFRVETTRGAFDAAAVVLATGGQSLPKSGSDGFGYELARRLGHAVVPTTPALAPLVFGSEAVSFPAGVSHDAELVLWVDRRVAIRLRGPLLWTHFGISGPVALNASRHWLRATLEGREVRLTVSFVPGETFHTVEARAVDVASRRPRLSIGSAVAELVPASIGAALLDRIGIEHGRELGRLARDDRRRVSSALVETPLPVTGCRGYNYAEVTAGGVALDEIDPATMESRVCPGLYLVGEILDVDGRIGGFNFQWAWSSAYAAGRALHESAVDR